MATVAETNALLAQYDSLATAALSKLAAIVDKMAAISPTDPNAAATLQSLEAEYQATKSSAEVQMKAVYAKYSAAYDSLTPAQQTQAANSPEAIRHKQVVSNGAANKARHESVYSSKSTAIKAATPAAPPPPPPPPPPAPPAAPTGNVAPAANAAPTISNAAPTKAPLTGAASDDSGAKQPNPAGSNGAPPSTPPGSGTGTAQPAGSSATQPNNSSPDAQSSAPALRTEASKTQPPGKRLKNPLAYLSSYTYQLSLYMITPDAYDAFIQSGRKDINALRSVTSGADTGALLIAQSGGINNAQEDRAPGFAFDYSIDNLSFNTITSGKAGEGDTNTTEIKFTITEPYGFSFVSNLRKAQKSLEKLAGEGIYLPKNPTKQFFILGIRFYGYDESGRIMKGDEVFDGATLDPNAPGNGALFQRYYDIILTDMKFKIDGKAITYNVSAASLAPAEAFGVKRGQVDTNINIEASDVESAINELMTKLNQRQKDLYKNSKNPDLYNTYSVKFLGEAETVIGKAKIVSPADLDKFKWPGSGAKKTADANDKTATKSNTPNNAKTQITISGSPTPTPIPAAINTIITQSQFLEQGLKTVYTTALEPPKDKTKPNQVDQGTKKVLKWFNVSSQLSNARWNPETSDWVYDITYIIQVYETPVIDSAYANVTTKYYGPHKRYSYWYTGQNSEVISYVQELNNAYFTVVVAPQEGAETASTENPSTDGASTGETGNGSKGTPAETPKNPGQPQPQATTGKLGAGKEAQNSYITSLYDPASQAEAKIQIFGDPDFIMVDSSYSEDQLYKKFYGADGFTVNPNGGQVFIEIDFKEAVDYSSDGSSIASPTGGAGVSGEPGTLSINESILFWEYPEDVAKLVKGISYQVLKVTSQFSGGSFKQTLDCRINTFADAAKPGSEGGGREPAANKTNQPAGSTPAAGTNTGTGKSPSASNATNADSGFKNAPSDKPSTNKAVASVSTALPPPGEIVVTASVRSIPTNSGFVADDDATGIQVNKNLINSAVADAGRETSMFANLNVRTTLLPPTITANTNPLLGRTI